MSDTTTPNLGLTQPAVGGSATTWGTKLNGNFAILDNCLPYSGATGQLHMNGQDIGGVNLLTATELHAAPGPVQIWGLGVQYNLNGIAGHYIAYQWDGAEIVAYVDGIDVGNVATQQWCDAAFATQQWCIASFMPLAGGVIGGNLNVNGLLSVFGGVNVDGGPFAAFQSGYIGGGLEVGGGLSTDTLTVNAGANIFNGLSVDSGMFQAWGGAEVAGNGIAYIGIGPGHFVAFGWTGSQLEAFVDGNNVGPVALAAELEALRAQVRELTRKLEALSG